MQESTKHLFYILYCVLKFKKREGGIIAVVVLKKKTRVL